MTYFEKNEQKQFFSMFSMLNAIGGIGNVADFTTPCVNITNSAFTQLQQDVEKTGEFAEERKQRKTRRAD